MRIPLLPVSVYRKLFERNRLKLPRRPAEAFGPPAGVIELPALYPLYIGEDTPLNDMLVLLNLARGRKARRILEVGTYRARTTCALYRNCPDAIIVSYDIQVLDSPFRRELLKAPNVELRHASFAASAETLRREPPFDFIFIDASHSFEHVLEDSRLALELLADNGVIVWHDYRLNDHPFEKGFRVPEALDVIAQSVPVYSVPGTLCAVHVRSSPARPVPNN
jgi:predicted O-methyltransferase YrrM